MRRFLSENVSFVVPDRPLTGGGDHREQVCGGESRYLAAIKTMAKAACTEQGWKCKNNDEPIYMIITINVNNLNYIPKKDRGKRKKDKLAVRSPYLSRIVSMCEKALIGIIYKRKAQLMAINICRRYCDKCEGVSILCGSPKDWGELNHDLRNA